MYTKKRSYGEEKLYSVKSGESKKESTNPIDKEGKIMRCHECDSKMHFASKCPHRQKGKGNQSDQQNACEVHLTLFAGTSNERQNILVESFGKGIIDSGCSKTVAGEA